MFDVLPIQALMDNYIWCIVNRTNRTCMIVDPGEAQPVFDALREHPLRLIGILITHHHWDHTQGITEILAEFSVPVFGPAKEKVAGMTHPLCGDYTVFVAEWAQHIKIIDIPGHTLGHIAYHLPGMVFTGDTLFTCGCGRIFEGTVDQMYHSLQLLSALDENTLVYCGHEYTLANLRFALAVEPENSATQQRYQNALQLSAKQIPLVPAPISLEKRTNPFLRCQEPSVIAAAEKYAGHTLETPQAVLSTLREWKNNF